MYDFAVDDHEDVMKHVVGWLRSTAHGDTVLSMHMPIFRDDDEGQGEEDNIHEESVPKP